MIQPQGDDIFIAKTGNFMLIVLCTTNARTFHTWPCKIPVIRVCFQLLMPLYLIVSIFCKNIILEMFLNSRFY